MAVQSITVTVQESMIYLRSGRPEEFELEYHIQRDDYLRLELPDNPLKIDIFLMAFKEHPQQERIVKIVATPYLDMLLNRQTAPQWTHPITHAADGGILILLAEE